MALADTTESPPRPVRRRAPCTDQPVAPADSTRHEVRAITRLLPRREPVTLLTGAAATEGAVAEAARGKRLVHLATHGFFATGRCRSALAAPETTDFDRPRDVIGFNPMVLGGVMLAGAHLDRDPLDREDGIWTAEEVASLDLRGAELVVPSACDTGLGEVVSREAVLGLRRAFSVAGAKSLVMSLWAVPDEATRRLMDATYQSMQRRGGSSPVRALRTAQLTMLQDNRSSHGEGRPWEWGGFIVAGPLD